MNKRNKTRGAYRKSGQCRAVISGALLCIILSAGLAGCSKSVFLTIEEASGKSPDVVISVLFENSDSFAVLDNRFKIDKRKNQVVGWTPTGARFSGYIDEVSSVTILRSESRNVDTLVVHLSEIHTTQVKRTDRPVKSVILEPYHIIHFDKAGGRLDFVSGKLIGRDVTGKPVSVYFTEIQSMEFRRTDIGPLIVASGLVVGAVALKVIDENQD